MSCYIPRNRLDRNSSPIISPRKTVYEASDSTARILKGPIDSKVGSSPLGGRCLLSSDRKVTPKLILKAIEDLQRRGSRRVMADLETFEPDLAEHFLEALTSIYHKLLQTGASRREVRELYRQIEALTLVSILSLRNAHEAMWQDFFKTSDQLDPTVTAGQDDHAGPPGAPKPDEPPVD